LKEKTMISINIHGVRRVELRDVSSLPNGGFYRSIWIVDRDGIRHDVSMFADTDADALRFDIQKETAE